MRCKVVRNQLLASARPARPPGVVADHLAECGACRAWHRQLVRIERLVPRLPVPPSSGKVDCVREVLHGEAYNRNHKAEVEWQRRERALRKVAITFAMAAGLLFFALVWYAWQHQGGGEMVDGSHPRRSEIERILAQHDEEYPKADTPQKRVKRLAKVMDRLHGQVCDGARTGTANDLATLAHQYDVVVREGLLTQARDVPVEERSQVLGVIAEQLARSESQARQLAAEFPFANKPLGDIAVVAHNGHLQLRELISGKF